MQSLITIGLRKRGGVGVTRDELQLTGVTAKRWRALARAAARALGRPVTTLEHTGGVWAQLQDWPANPLEDAIHRAAMRRAITNLPDSLDELAAETPARGIAPVTEIDR